MKDNNMSMGGRPPKDPGQKVGTPARALVTIGVAEALIASANRHGIPKPGQGLIASDIVRLGLYLLLQKDGMIDAFNLYDDPSWDGLKQKGLV